MKMTRKIKIDKDMKVSCHDATLLRILWEAFKSIFRSKKLR
jgi:hypothetical protein